MNLEQQMYEALELLGSTAEDVANSLERLGVRGQRWVTCACPLAVYLAQKFPNATSFSVGVRDAAMFVSPGGWVTVPIPSGAEAFRRQFDRGAFKNLVAAP